MTNSEKYDLVEILEGDVWHVRSRLKTYLEKVEVEDEAEKPKGTRTGQQNRALHKDCDLIAEKLNTAGLDMRVVLKPTYSLPWTTESVKEHLWRPIMKALFGYESTTELRKGQGEIEKVHEVLLRELGEKHGIEWYEFPSDVPRQLEELGGYRTRAGESPVDDYPELTEMPTI